MPEAQSLLRFCFRQWPLLRWLVTLFAEKDMAHYADVLQATQGPLSSGPGDLTSRATANRFLGVTFGFSIMCILMRLRNQRERREPKRVLAAAFFCAAHRFR